MGKYIALSILLIAALTGVNLYKQSKKDPTFILMYAIKDQGLKSKIAQQYIKNASPIAWNSFEHEGESMLNILISNCQPWSQDCKETAELILAQGEDINKIAPRQGFAPLHTAMTMNNPDAIKFLMLHGSNWRLRTGEGKAPGLTSLELAESMERMPTEGFVTLKELVTN